MLTYLNQKRGQSTLEYAVLVVIIIGALLSIQFYLKRGIQGRLKSSADDIGDQYSVDNTNVLKSTNTFTNTTEEFGGRDKQGISKSTIITDTTSTREKSLIGNEQQEFMGIR